MPVDQEKELEDLIYTWQYDPYKFAVEAIGITPTRQQKEALDALGNLARVKCKSFRGHKLSPSERKLVLKKGISIRAGRGCGKDTWCVMAMLWFGTCFQYSSILATANTKDQLKDVLWREIAVWLRRSNEDLGDGTAEYSGLLSQMWEWNAEKIYVKGTSSDGSKEGSEWWMVARTCNAKASSDDQAETLSGRHNPYQMLVVDEASSVPDPVFTPITGTLTGECNLAIIIFNPVRTTGYAARTHLDPDITKLWETFHWNAEEVPELYPADYLEAAAIEFRGTDTDAYRIWVQGEFPRVNPDTLIPWEWIMNAVDRDIETTDKDPLKVGVDIGGGIDLSAIVTRWGNKVIDIQVKDSADTVVIAKWVAKYCGDLSTRKSGLPDIVLIDGNQIGNGVYNLVRRWLDQIIIWSVNVGEKASIDDKRFDRLREELYWKLRTVFECGDISIPNDDGLIAELSSLKLEDRDDGKIKLWSKRKMKAHGLTSPNKADALVQTYLTDDITHATNRKAKACPYDEEYGDDDLFLENATNGPNSWMAV